MADPLMSVYGRLPVAFTHGEGPWLWDTQGNKYLDAIGGFGVCVLGHAHPVITKTICEQAKALLHTSNLYQIPEQQALAKRLNEIAGTDSAFFCNSGTEANEVAIKLARQYGHKRGIEEPAILVMENSYHGRSLATLSASGSRKLQAGFEPLVQGFIRVPYNDTHSIQEIARHHKNIVAILVEPMQFEGGMRFPSADYLPTLRALCDKHHWLLMVDEVRTGIGKSGHWFAYQKSGILPDVVTLSRGLGNGVPIGACLARGEAARIFKQGHHGSTHGGNPFSCRVASTVLDVIEKNDLLTQATTIGQRILSRLQLALEDKPFVADIRGEGLLIAIELKIPCLELPSIALKRGLLVSVIQEKIIRLIPPLILGNKEADLLVDTLSQLINTFAEAY